MLPNEPQHRSDIRASVSVNSLARPRASRLTGGQLWAGCLVLLGWVFCWPSADAAQRWQSTQSIHDAARDFITAVAREAHGVQPTIVVNTPDDRLRLAKCPQDLEAFMPPGGRTQGRTVVGVRCPEGKQWSIFVPVEIKIQRRLVVAARPLGRGDRLDNSDLKLALFDVTKVRGAYLTDIEQVSGKALKRAVSAGTPITAAIVATPKLVKRGQEVTLLIEIGNIVVRSKGKALADGGSGDRIRIRNTSSKRIIEGTVVSAHTVKVGS